MTRQSCVKRNILIGVAVSIFSIATVDSGVVIDIAGISAIPRIKLHSASRPLPLMFDSRGKNPWLGGGYTYSPDEDNVENETNSSAVAHVYFTPADGKAPVIDYLPDKVVTVKSSLEKPLPKPKEKPWIEIFNAGTPQAYARIPFDPHTWPLNKDIFRNPNVKFDRILENNLKWIEVPSWKDLIGRATTGKHMLKHESAAPPRMMDLYYKVLDEDGNFSHWQRVYVYPGDPSRKILVIKKSMLKDLKSWDVNFINFDGNE